MIEKNIIGRINEVSGSVVKLDVKDKKILSLLSHDGRIHISKIAESVRLSKDSIRYRMRRLRQKGVILKYSPMIDLTQIGYNTYHVLLLIDEKNKERTDEFIKFLVDHPNTKTLMQYTSQWDINWGLVAKDVREFDEVVSEVMDKFKDIIKEKDSLEIIRGYHSINLPNKFYNETKKIFKPIIKKTTKTKIDEKDIKILRELCEDSRTSSYNIATKTGMSPDSVIYRIKKMHKSNFIRRFTTVINLTSINYHLYTLCMDLKTLNKKDDSRLMEFVTNHPHIIRTVRVLGDWDIMMMIATENTKEFHNTVKQIKDEFVDLIISYQTWFGYKEHCYYTLPKIVSTETSSYQQEQHETPSSHPKL